MLAGLAGYWVVATGEDTAPPGCEHKAKGARKEVVELPCELVQGTRHLHKYNSMASLPGLDDTRHAL